MASTKDSSRHHILLWVGLTLVGVALVLALVGAIYASYSASQSNTAPRGSAASPSSTEETSGKTRSSSSGTVAPSGVPSSLSEARAAFEKAVSDFSNSNLEVEDVMEFANNYYAQVRESDTGIGAMELLIDKGAGRVHPEPGPNMMWNTKYGMMSGRGMMGPNGGGMMGPGGGGMMGGTYRLPTLSGEPQRSAADNS